MKLATSMYRSPSIKQSHGSKSWLHSWNIYLRVRNSRHMLLGIMYAGTFAHTVPQPPYSICEAKSSLELRQELLRAGTEDRVAIGSVVLMLCCFVLQHPRSVKTSWNVVHPLFHAHMRAISQRKRMGISYVPFWLMPECSGTPSLTPLPTSPHSVLTATSMLGRRDDKEPRTARKLPRPPH